jgi:N-acetylmuramoyl-L-alanine amidase
MTKAKKRISLSTMAVFILAVFLLALTNIGAHALGTGPNSPPAPKNDSNTATITTTNTNSTNSTKNTTKGITAKNRIIICIDPGHQKKGMKELEPIGPGSKIKKAAVSSGTTGVFTKKPEYKLNLEVSLKIREYMEGLGYKVVMTRDKNEVTLSNIDRAKIANVSGAAIFVRIHGNGSQSKKTNGFSVIYPSEKDVYTKKIWEQSKLAAQFVEKEIKKETTAKSMGSVPRADLTGLNWSKLPVILVEMGFMSNVEEDKKLSEENYQMKMADGIAKGIDYYIKSLDVK